jgi:hypothetical protein
MKGHKRRHDENRRDSPPRGCDWGRGRKHSAFLF